jgi:RimJ/RimL family protein N-acetyltransferase
MGDAFAIPGSLDHLPELEGPRVRLRAPRHADAADVYAVYSDPQVLRYWSHGPWTDPAQADDWIARSWSGFAERAVLQWVIARREDDRVLGSTTLFSCAAQHRRCEIGYALGAAHWGQGRAREALALAVAQAFAVLGLHRIEADIDPRNHASLRLVEALGFRHEGTLRGRYHVGGEIQDSAIYGLLADDRACG